MPTGLRYFTTADIDRPSFDPHGDRSYTSVASGVRFSFWDRRNVRLFPAQGELRLATAQGFLPSGTDVQERDRITSLGSSWQVVTVVSGRDDRGVLDHLGVMLVDL